MDKNKILIAIASVVLLILIVAIILVKLPKESKKISVIYFHRMHYLQLNSHW